MSPRSMTQSLVRDAPRVTLDDTIGTAVRAILDSDLPAVPVVDADGAFAGVFGEREFLEALFPGYLGQLKSASFVRKTLDDALEKRSACASQPISEHVFTEHVEVSTDASDLQIAETFLHHRILVLPVCDGPTVVGVITRRSFFAQLADRVLDD